MLEAIVFDGKRRLGRMDSPAREGRGGRKRAILADEVVSDIMDAADGATDDDPFILREL